MAHLDSGQNVLGICGFLERLDPIYKSVIIVQVFVSDKMVL